jgi:hypothetical protein
LASLVKPLLDLSFYWRRGTLVPKVVRIGRARSSYEQTDTESDVTEETHMADFLFLFRGGMRDPAEQTPAELQAGMQRWMGWIGGIATKGQLKGGQPLQKGGTVIAGKKRLVTDGPYAEAKDVVGGYLIVTAKDLPEAIEIARGCPGPDEEGSVEVRELAPMPG